MYFPKLLRFIAGLTLCLLPVLSKAQVEASLVTSKTQVVSGQPFTVALHLVHETHWHTYWLNPGTGLATSITWNLPKGWKASDIQWPTPQMIKDVHGIITGTDRKSVV